MTDRLLTVDEAAEVLQVSTSWLRKRVAARAVPCVRLGRTVRFADSDIAQIVAKNRQTA